MTERGHVIPTLKNINMKFTCNNDNDNDDSITDSNDKDSPSTTETANVKPKFFALEIGLGFGDNILTNAVKFSDRYYSGAEIHSPGMPVALSRMEKRQLNMAPIGCNRLG